MAKTLIATIDTFTKGGRLVPRGASLSSDEVDYDKDTSTNLTEAPKGVEGAGAVEMSAIAPTGPNPVNPQQIAAGVVQTLDGYVDRGASLVGEVTKPAKERLVQIVDADDTTQGDVQAALDDHAAAQADQRATDSAALAAGGGTTAPAAAAPAAAPAKAPARRAAARKAAAK